VAPSFNIWTRLPWGGGATLGSVPIYGGRDSTSDFSRTKVGNRCNSCGAWARGESRSNSFRGGYLTFDLGKRCRVETRRMAVALLDGHLWGHHGTETGSLFGGRNLELQQR